MRAPHHYRLYGLTLSSPLALPCPPLVDPAKADVIFSPGSDRRFAPARRELSQGDTLDQWFWCKRLSDGSRYLRWTSLFEFLLSPDGRHIRYRCLEKGTPESFTVYLLGQVLSFALVARGVEPLHGTASWLGTGTAVFIGGCGSGKSTLAAALLANGFPAVADDLVALTPVRREWQVHPGIPRLKLFPSIACRVLGRDVRTPRMNPGTSKLVLPLDGRESIGDRTVRLGVIYLLSPPTGQNATARRGVRIEPLSRADALLELVGAAFNLVVTERSRLANQFVFASQLAASVPVRRLIYPRRLSALDEVCAAVAADVENGRVTDGPKAPPPRDSRRSLRPARSSGPPGRIHARLRRA